METFFHYEANATLLEQCLHFSPGPHHIQSTPTDPTFGVFYQCFFHNQAFIVSVFNVNGHHCFVCRRSCDLGLIDDCLMNPEYRLQGSRFYLKPTLTISRMRFFSPFFRFIEETQKGKSPFVQMK